MKRVFNIVILLFSIFSLLISYQLFISFRYQLQIREDILSQKSSFSSSEILKIPSIPNISVTGIPIAALQANYFLNEGKYPQALKLLNKATTVNRYLYFSDFMMAKFNMMQKNYDSAYFYSKKAFFGWPKNIEHYKMYNNLLVRRKDTMEILQAYDSINKRFIDRSEYYDTFVSSYADAKLRYLITEYDSLTSVSNNDLIGKWQQAYEFETGEINYLNNFISFSKLKFTSPTASYDYKLKTDTLFIYFQSNQKLVAKYPVYFSNIKNTLVLKNVPKYINMDSLVNQNQFFKKIE